MKLSKSNSFESKNHISKFLQLLILTYLFLYMFPFPFGNIPGFSYVLVYWDNAINYLTIWVGHHLLGIVSLKKIEMTGSGDTHFDYIKLFTTVILSFLLSIIIFYFTYKRKEYKKLNTFITIYARYFVAIYLMGYGFVKLQQFPFPGVNRMEQTYGSSSPMGLLWTFMGYSKLYLIFSGFCEITAAALLLFRRTAVLGSLVSVLVMTNVVMLNFSYDVPVKLFSVHLVLISLFILSPNIINIFRFFVLHHESKLSVPQLTLINKKARIGRILLKSIIIIGIPVLTIFEIIDNEDESKNNQLNGTYLTQSFIKNNDTLTVQSTDTGRWNKMFIEGNNSKILFLNDSSVYYQIVPDTSLHVIHLTSYTDSTKKFTLNYKQVSDTVFSLSGKYNSDTIAISFKRKILSDYALAKRGFHWVNDYPYNR